MRHLWRARRALPRGVGDAPPNCRVGSACTGNVCQPCGTMGLPCCPPAGGQMRCQAPAACGNIAGPDMCVATCGGAGQPCCVPDNTCAAGNLCDAPGMGAATTCQPCGGASQVCCPMNACTAPSKCIDLPMGTPNRCGACGAADQECCVEPSPCYEGSALREPREWECRPSVAPAAPKISRRAGNVCNAGLGCDDPMGPVPGTCRSTCGSAGAACCAGNNCQPTLRCLGGAADGGVAGMTCQACGAIGQRCCNAGD